MTTPLPSVTASDPTTLAAGSQLGPYQVDSLIGRGGMGEVYRARDTRLGRKVALKVLSPTFAKNSERLARFTQEARTVALLNHPNIVTVYDVGAHDGAPFIVSELLQGDTLRARMTQGALPPAVAVRYALQIAEGLVAAHQHGVVHRDLKPENIFLADDGRVKILDFGLAKCRQEALEVLQHTSSVSTQSGMLMGTVGYMSPEQVRGLPADHRSDIFSLGVILYEMVSGRSPFRQDSVLETLNAILKDDPPRLRSSDGKISAKLEHVIRHCLEKDPEIRFQSARDLIFNLELGLRLARGNGQRSKKRAASGSSSRGFLAALLRRMS